MNGFDLSTITNAYVGSTPASAIYLGSTLIWPNQPVNPYESQYFTIEITQAGNLYLKSSYANGTQPTLISFDYSLNNGSWQTVTEQIDNPGGLYGTIAYIGSFSVGDIIRIRHTGSFNNGEVVGRRFEGSAYFKVYGNIMSLLYSDSFIGKYSLISAYEFHNMFYDNTISYLTDCENLVLPATSLTQNCYQEMFRYAIITKAPVLPAITLVENCYGGMFYGCSNLNYVKCYATNVTNPPASLGNWLYNVAATGTFYKDANTTYPTGTSGIPSGWTIENIQ